MAVVFGQYEPTKKDCLKKEHKRATSVKSKKPGNESVKLSQHFLTQTAHRGHNTVQ